MALKAHKPADSGVVAGNVARRCSLFDGFRKSPTAGGRVDADFDLSIPPQRNTRSETGVCYFGNDPQSDFERRGKVNGSKRYLGTPTAMITINKINPALYITSLVVSSAMSYYVVISNYTNGFYPTNQDTIAIPLVTTTALLAILLLLSLSQYPLYKRLKSERPSSLPATSLALFATAVSSILLIKSTSYWLSPNHFTLSTLYFITLSSYLFQQFNLYKRLVSPLKQGLKRG
ncbi:hypothetical protein D3C81_856670 [compost metagenome]